VALGSTDAAAVEALPQFTLGPRTTLRTRPPRLLTDRWRHGFGKSPWTVTVLQAYGGRLAIEATTEPPVTVSRNQRLRRPTPTMKFQARSGEEILIFRMKTQRSCLHEVPTPTGEEGCQSLLAAEAFLVR
jgi:hypothetical protein